MRAADSAKAVLFLQIILSSWAKTPTVKLSIPEGHYIILICPGHAPEDSAPLEWRDGGGQVVATKQGHSAHSNNKDKYSLLTDGSLFVKSLQSGDSGEFRCGDQVAADVEVLTGEDYVVSAGRTVHLPCKVSDKQTHKWTFRKNKTSERQIIFVKFANGTLRKEIEDPRNRFTRTSQNSLHISDLQPSDAGQYWCNGKKAAVLAVRTEKPDDKNQTDFTTDETDTGTDISENGDPDHDNVPMAVLIGLCALILLAVVLIFLLINRKRYRKGDRQEIGLHETLGPADEVRHPVTMATEESKNKTQDEPMTEAAELHYASLGHQNWRERPRAQDERHHVIYSTVAGGPG